jgi:type I restriction enzyme S subunit
MASLKEYRMAIPEDSLLRKFDDIVMPIISRIKSNDNQSDSLAELRDTLLPKLMSGELHINN